jgi:FG-GAP-like repeat
MIRTPTSLGAIATILVEIFVVTAFASAQEGKNDHLPLPAVAVNSDASGESFQDDADKVLPLVVTGDFNHDGVADIAKIILPNEDSAEPVHLMVLLGQSSGTYKEIAFKPMLGRTPRTMVVGDFNNDGIPDLIVGDEDGGLTLLLGEGDGNFSSGREIAHLESVRSIAVADFNKDGILDIAISDWRASSVTVLLGTGNGSFGHEWSVPLRMRGTTPHIAAADFNADGIPDLAVIYDEDEEATFDVILGNGNGTFTIAPEWGFVRDANSHCNTL